MTSPKESTGSAGRAPADVLEISLQAAFEEILIQRPSAVDCSASGDKSQVVVFDGIDLRKVVSAALRAAFPGVIS